jgi:transposase
LKNDDIPITAPFVRDGPINGESFLAYVEQVLAPTLKHGDIVVMDNLGSPKRAAINKAIRAKGARRFFLPQYSPDLNPIEQVFAKLKKLLRKAEERTPDGVWRRIVHCSNASLQPNAQRAIRGSQTVLLSIITVSFTVLTEKSTQNLALAHAFGP